MSDPGVTAALEQLGHALGGTQPSSIEADHDPAVLGLTYLAFETLNSMEPNMAIMILMTARKDLERKGK